MRLNLGLCLCQISIHAPREGSDSFGASLMMPLALFLSTLPARGATWGGLRPGLQDLISIHAPREGSDTAAQVKPEAWSDFYPRSPRGERPSKRDREEGNTVFLSTLPARGATSVSVCVLPKPFEFLSTLPARGATLCAAHCTQSFPFLSTLPARGATILRPG